VQQSVLDAIGAKLILLSKQDCDRAAPAMVQGKGSSLAFSLLSGSLLPEKSESSDKDILLSMVFCIHEGDLMNLQNRLAIGLIGLLGGIMAGTVVGISEVAAQTTNQQLDQTEVQQPGQTEVQQPGQTEVQQPGQTEVQQPGQTGIQQPGQTGIQQPGQTGVQQPGQTGVQQPGQTDTQQLDQQPSQTDTQQQFEDQQQDQEDQQQIQQNTNQTEGVRALW